MYAPCLAEDQARPNPLTHSEPQISLTGDNYVLLIPEPLTDVR